MRRGFRRIHFRWTWGSFGDCWRKCTYEWLVHSHTHPTSQFLEPLWKCPETTSYLSQPQQTPISVATESSTLFTPPSFVFSLKIPLFHKPLSFRKTVTASKYSVFFMWWNYFTTAKLIFQVVIRMILENFG